MHGRSILGPFRNRPRVGKSEDEQMGPVRGTKRLLAGMQVLKRIIGLEEDSITWCIGICVEVMKMNVLKGAVECKAWD